MSAHTTLIARMVPRRRARMLTACAWCERIRLGDRWVDAMRAIAHLRTYEWNRAPQFTHGICDPCLAEQLAKRKREAEPRPQASLYSQRYGSSDALTRGRNRRDEPHRQAESDMTAPADVSVIDNADELRYELRLDGVFVADIRYRLEPGVRVLVDIDVAPRLEGHGLGSHLVEGALNDLRARGLAVVPHAPFVADFIRLHPEYADLVTADPEVSD